MENFGTKNSGIQKEISHLMVEPILVPFSSKTGKKSLVNVT